MADGKVIYEVRADNSKLDSDISASGKIAESSAGKAFAGVGKVIATAIGAAVVAGTAGAVAGVKYNAQMQQYAMAFKTMLGDGQKATKMLADLRDMAAKTPFELTDLAGASQTLMAFGLSAEDTMKSLQMLGDVSMGDAQKLSSLTLAFAQVQSAGRLTGQDLLQMINAGFNPLQVISEKTGKSLAELRDEMQKGGISAQDVADAFAIATSEGGRFFGAMEAQGQTFNGLLSTLKDNAMMLLGNLTQGLTDLLSESFLPKLIDYVGRLNDAFTEGGLKGFFEELGDIINELIDDIPGMDGIKQFFEDLGKAVKPLADEIIPTFKSIWDDLQNLFRTLVDELAEPVKDLFLSLVESISTLIGEKVLPFLVEQFSEFIKSIIEFLEDNSEQIQQAFKDIAGLVEDLCGVLDGLIDLLTVFDDTSEDVSDTLNFTLSGAISGVIDQFNNVISVIRGVLSALEGLLKFIAGVFQGEWSSAWQSLQDVAVGVLNTIIGLINTAIGVLNLF